MLLRQLGAHVMLAAGLTVGQWLSLWSKKYPAFWQSNVTTACLQQLFDFYFVNTVKVQFCALLPLIEVKKCSGNKSKRVFFVELKWPRYIAIVDGKSQDELEIVIYTERSGTWEMGGCKSNKYYREFWHSLWGSWIYAEPRGRAWFCNSHCCFNVQRLKRMLHEKGRTLPKHWRGEKKGTTTP